MTMRDEFEAWYAGEFAAGPEAQAERRAELLRARVGDFYADDWDGLADGWKIWQAATEAAAKKCEEISSLVASYDDERAERAVDSCAAAIRGKGE